MDGRRRGRREKRRKREEEEERSEREEKEKRREGKEKRREREEKGKRREGKEKRREGEEKGKRISSILKRTEESSLQLCLSLTSFLPSPSAASSARLPSASLDILNPTTETPLPSAGEERGRSMAIPDKKKNRETI